MTTLRPGLRWTLAATVVASAVAVLWPDRPGVDVAVAALAGGAATDLLVETPLARPQPAPDPALARPGALPRELPEARIDPSRFDPFVGVVPPPPPPPAPVAAAPAPPPQAPAPSYAFMGRMKAPDGSEAVYLVRGDAVLPVQAGTRLDDGYVVEAITNEAVRLHYPALDTHASIPIPLPADSAVQ